MAKLTRKTQKLFGVSAGLNQIAQFGSLANSTPTFSTDPAVIQGLAEYLEGWFSAVIGSNSPTIEDMNALFYVMAYQMVYMFQEGIPEYDAATTYYAGSIVQDGNGICYISKIDNNTGGALSDAALWNTGIGAQTRNANGASLNIASGQSYFQPQFTVPVGVTWTVQSGGYINAMGPVKVLGTLTCMGTGRVI